MPRVVEITVPAGVTEALTSRLSDHDDVLSLRVLRDVSLQPPGDVVVAQVLDTGLADVMRLADDVGLGEDPSVSLTTSLPQSVVSADAHERVIRDRTTGSWEEVELIIGRESTMSPPKIIVMALAGLFAGVGLQTGALHVIVGAMLVAPAYEPLARVSLGLVNRTRGARDGLHDFAVAYAALAVGAAFVGVLTSITGSPLSESTNTYLPTESFEKYWTTITWTSVLVAAGGGVGGGLLIVLNRRVLTTGIVIALALVPSVTLAVLELFAGQPSLAGQAMLRWALDVAFVVIGCTVVFEIKRRTDGRRTTSP